MYQSVPLSVPLSVSLSVSLSANKLLFRLPTSMLVCLPRTVGVFEYEGDYAEK